MDVKPLLSCLLLFLLAACSQEKTVNSVYKENRFNYKTCSKSSIEGKFLVHWEDGSFTSVSSDNVDSFKENFLKKNLKNVKSAEQDSVIKLSLPSADIVKTFDASNTWAADIIEAPAVWDKHIEGEGITVGVVDSYIDVDHPQIKPRLLMPSTRPQQINPHGTHVAGTILADPNFGPAKGIAPKAKLIPAGFLNADGSGGVGDAIAAINYAVANGAKIINASWGGTACSSLLSEAVSDLEQKGVLFVAAAGNDGVPLESLPEYPAVYNFPHQLTIAAATPDDFMAYFSNSSFNLVHLAAPGVEIFSTLPDGMTGKMTGTSMATPIVSGAAALIWSAYPTATVYQVKAALMNSVDVRPYHEYKVVTQGRLNVRKALDELQKIVAQK